MDQLDNQALDDFTAAEICYIVMVSHGLLSVTGSTVHDATQKWQRDFKENCGDCPAVNNCALARSEE